LRAHARSRSANSRTNARAMASLDGRVVAEHTNSRAELGSPKRYHVLADMLSNNLTVLRVGVSENVLNEIVAVLITRNVDQWNTRTIKTALADAVEIAAEKVDTTNLEAFLNNLGSELIHAILGRIADDMVNCSAAISWRTMLTDVLNAPVAKLAVSNNVNTGENLLDARALKTC